jgi:glycosyltransferase involved in cell wall biosynthesis
MGPPAEMPRPAEFIIVPVCNEGDRVSALAARWSAALEQAGISFELHCCDDGSTERSTEGLAARARAYKRVVPQRHENRGHGQTVARGYLDHADAARLFQVDADDVIGPDLLDRWWPEREAFDLLLASRHDPHRRWLRRTLTHVARGASACCSVAAFET